MRILLIWSYNESYVRGFYARRPWLAERSYQEQQTALLDDFFSWPGYLVRGFRALGHQAELVVQNIKPLQLAWARERQITPNDDEPTGDGVCLRQVAEFQPDVLFLWPGFLDRETFLKPARQLGAKTFCWIASPLHVRPSIDSIDCILTSFPHFVEAFRKMGARAEFFQGACFEPAILDALTNSVEGEIPVSFVGGLTPSGFSRRLDILTRVVSRVPLEVWGYGLNGQSSRRPWKLLSSAYWRWRSRVLRDRYHGDAYGLDFFSVLHRSRITLNVHIDAAEGVASNMRLFESTGCGTLLLTEESRLLPRYFIPGEEVVTFGDANDLERQVRYYLSHEAERARIAFAGQQRTLRDHNSTTRAKQLVDIFDTFV